MTINTEFRTKGTCDMASHAYKMHDVAKMFLDLYKSNCTKKKISELHQEHALP